MKNLTKTLYSKDVGVIADKTGFTVTVGGSAGYNPRLADIVIQDITENQALNLVDNIFKYYKETAESGEKLGFFIDRIGITSLVKKYLKAYYQVKLDSGGV